MRTKLWFVVFVLAVGPTLAMSAGSSATAQAAPAATLRTAHDGAFTGIACEPKTTTCFAVGTRYTSQGSIDYGLLEVIRAGVPSSTIKFPSGGLPNSVTCQTSTDCWVIGSLGAVGFVATLDNGKLGTLTPVPGTAVLYAVSCGSVTTCWATAANTHYSGSDLVKITASGPAVNPLEGSSAFLFRAQEGGNTNLSCWSATSCVALGSQNPSSGGVVVVVMSLRSGKITSTNKVAGTTFPFFGLACWSPSSCLGADEGSVYPITDGKAGAPQKFPGAMIFDVACPSATRCEAVGITHVGTGYDAVLVPFDAGKPGKVSKPFTGPLVGVACTSTTACWAVGNRGHNTGIVYSFSL